MAEAGPKWPGEVTFDDEDPKRGYARVSFSIPNLKVKKALFGKSEPENATINPQFTKQSVCVRVAVRDNGTETVYQYKKSLPEDLDPEKSSYKVKTGQVILSLCKLEPVTWAAHAKYFIKKE